MDGRDFRREAALRAFDLTQLHRRAARLLLSLFGTSDFLSKRFLRHPELIDALFRSDQVAPEKDLATFRAELDERLGRLPEARVAWSRSASFASTTRRWRSRAGGDPRSRATRVRFQCGVARSR